MRCWEEEGVICELPFLSKSMVPSRDLVCKKPEAHRELQEDGEGCSLPGHRCTLNKLFSHPPPLRESYVPSKIISFPPLSFKQMFVTPQLRLFSRGGFLFLPLPSHLPISVLFQDTEPRVGLDEHSFVTGCFTQPPVPDLKVLRCGSIREFYVATYARFKNSWTRFGCGSLRSHTSLI